MDLVIERSSATLYLYCVFVLLFFVLCIYIYIYIYIYMCIFFIYIYIYICAYFYIYIYICVCIYDNICRFVSPHHFVAKSVPQPFQPCSRQRSSACGKLARPISNVLRTMKDRLEANRRMLAFIEPGSEEFHVATARQQAIFNASLTATPHIPEMEAG